MGRAGNAINSAPMSRAKRARGVVNLSIIRYSVLIFAGRAVYFLYTF
jgi:hypothetical protein